MKRRVVSAGGAFLCLLVLGATALPGTASAQGLVEKEAAAELKAAEDRVRAAQNDVNRAQRAYDGHQKAFDAALAEIEQQETAISGLKDAVHAARNARDAAEPGLRGELESWRKKVRKLRKADAPREEIEDARRYVRAYENWLRRRLGGHQGVVRIRRARLQRALDDLKEQQARAERIGQVGLDAYQELEGAENSLAEARTALNALLADLDERLKDVDPPYLEEVLLWRQDGGQYYDVKWELQYGHADEALKRERDLVEALIEGTQEVLRRQNQNFAEWERILAERAREAQRLNEEYVSYMTSLTGAWVRATLIELVDVGVDIVLDAKDFGPYSFAINAVKQVTNTAYDAFMDKRRRPEWDIARLPGIGTPGPSATMAGFHTDVVKKKLFRNGLLEIIKVAAEAKNEKLGGPVGVALNGFKSPGDLTKAGFALSLQKLVIEPMTEQFKNGAWTDRMQDFSRYQFPQRLFGKEMSKRILGEDNWQKAARELAEGAEPPRSYMRNFAKKFADPNLWKGLAIGMVQEELKVRALEAADQTRIEKWTAYLAADTKRIFAHEQFVSAARKRRLSRIALEAYRERHAQILRELGNPEYYRKKVAIMDEVLRRKGRYDLRLIFNRDVQIRRVTVGGTEVPGRLYEDRVWSGNFDAADLPSAAQLSVDAWIEVARRQLDDPSTYASYDSTRRRWRNYEPGPDRNHVFRIEKSGKADDPGPPPERGTGVSYVFVVDTSGSMGDHNRLEKAKAALKDVLDSRPSAPGDETALLTFNDCRIRRSMPFTHDIESLKQAADKLTAGGGTPLGAAVAEAAAYLRNQSSNREHVLIVLTDGEESCSGDFYGALMEARRSGLKADEWRVR